MKYYILRGDLIRKKTILFIISIFFLNPLTVFASTDPQDSTLDEIIGDTVRVYETNVEIPKNEIRSELKGKSEKELIKIQEAIDYKYENTDKEISEDEKLTLSVVQSILNRKLVIKTILIFLLIGIILYLLLNNERVVDYINQELEEYHNQQIPNKE